MAPELRAPYFEGCSLASDMYSVGGLLFVSFFPDTTPSTIQVSEEGVEVEEHEDASVAPLVRKLLRHDRTARPTASEALALPLFAAAGAQQLERVQEQQREIERLKHELAAEEQHVKAELARRRAAVDADKRRVHKEVGALKKQERRQQEAEEQLREKQAKVQQQERSIRERQAEAERLHRDKLRLLREKEEVLRRERQAVEHSRFARPEHWSAAPSAAAGGGLRLIAIPDTARSGVFGALQAHLDGTGIGDGGRDQQQHGRYSRLKLVRAWRVEHDELYSAYRVACRRVQSLAAQVPLRKERKARIRSELYGASQRLPWALDESVNEVRLLHGTKPELVLSILTNGMNERFAGSSAGTAFGDVSAKCSKLVPLLLLPAAPAE